jgi:hypothetical protein
MVTGSPTSHIRISGRQIFRQGTDNSYKKKSLINEFTNFCGFGSAVA